MVCTYTLIDISNTVHVYAHTHYTYKVYPLHTHTLLHYIMSFNYCLVTTVTWLLDCKLLMINSIMSDTLYTLHWYMFLWLYCESLNEIIIII